MEKIKEIIENKITELEIKGVLDDTSISTLDKLLNMHKNLENEEYWKSKKEAMNMRYRDYNYMDEGYGRRRRDSHGRYMGERDDRYGHHIPEDYWERVMDGYDGYMDGIEKYRRGNYNGKGQSIEGLERMLDGIYAFMEDVYNDPEQPEIKDVVKHYIKRFAELYNV